MSKRLIQFIATLFVLIGGWLFYEVFLRIPPKGSLYSYWPLAVLSGLIVGIGILILAWAAKRRYPN